MSGERLSDDELDRLPLEAAKDLKLEIIRMFLGGAEVDYDKYRGMLDD